MYTRIKMIYIKYMLCILYVCIVHESNSIMYRAFTARIEFYRFSFKVLIFHASSYHIFFQTIRKTKDSDAVRLSDYLGVINSTQNLCYGHSEVPLQIKHTFGMQFPKDTIQSKCKRTFG